MSGKKPRARKTNSIGLNLELGAQMPHAAVPAAHLRAGDLCPNCKVERLDYDGLLNLSCPQCGPVDGAWGGCS